MEGKYDDHSEPDDFSWNIETELTNNHEARVQIGGFKYPHKDVNDQKAFSKHDLHCDLTFGERWSHYDTITFGCFNSSSEDVLADLDKTIDMLQAARVKFAELMVEFPAESWSPDNG